VRVLETDPALSARLLRLVNSPGYALRMRCTSLRHAAALVGLERLNHIATTAAVLEMFSDSSEAASRLLDHSTMVGAFCRYFAVTFSLPAEELFTCGFLHDIGKLLLLEAEGASYAELLDATAPQHVHEKERERFGFDHASLGAHVLSAWNIPEPVPLVVAWHHDSIRVYEGPLEVAAMIETLRLADDIAHSMGAMSDDRAIRNIEKSDAAARLNLGRHELSRMWPELRALREHCRAQRSNQTHFVDVTSIRPTASLPPPSAAPPVSRPSEPSCSACGLSTSGDVCSACEAHLCQVHHESHGGWCERCVGELSESRGSAGLAEPLKLGLAAAAFSLLLGTVFGALQDGASGSLRLLVAPLVALALTGAVLGVGQRWLVRRRFLASRAALQSPLTLPSPAPPERESEPLPAVLTIPPSAYDRLPVLRALAHDVLSSQSSRDALLGSSRPPTTGVIPTPLPSIDAVHIEAAPPRPAAEPVPVEQPPLVVPAAQTGPALTAPTTLPPEARSAPAFTGFSPAARTPRRGPRRDRSHRRRDR
jgi:HD-like signal output (HDOD) protein